jgi:hypothetical protein
MDFFLNKFYFLSMFRSAEVPKHDEKTPLILQNTCSLIAQAKNTQ